MTAKRKKAEASILALVNSIDKSGINGGVYEDLLARLTDKQFDKMMERLTKEEYFISILDPLESGVKVTYENNTKLMAAKGYPLFAKMTDTSGGVTVESDIDNWVLMATIRGMKQTSAKGVSVTDGLTKDPTTGAVTGASASAKLSSQEVTVLQGLGLNKVIDELYKVRGGDAGAEDAIHKQMALGLDPTIAAATNASTGIQSLATVEQLFKGAMIEPIKG